MRRTTRLLAIAATGAALVATALPATAITGGQPTGDGSFRNVALITFYAKDFEDETVYYRYRCTGTLVSPTVVLTAAHCTYITGGATLVTFSPDVAPVAPPNNDPLLSPLPRAADDSATGPDGWGSSSTGFAHVGTTKGNQKYYDWYKLTYGTTLENPTYYSGTAYKHPDYSNFTDLKNWNDVGVIVLDQEVEGIGTAPVAPQGFLDQFTPKVLNKTVFTPVGYGTEVRKPVAGPQKPTPMSYPLIRRVTTSNGQKLTPQILQTNGNPNNNIGDGGTCFGDSGGPTFKDGYVVTVTSYGYTSNCRYLDGLQRIDIPGVADILADAIGDSGSVPANWELISR